MKKIVSVMIITVLCVAALVGCGHTESKDTGATEVTKTALAGKYKCTSISDGGISLILGAKDVEADSVYVEFTDDGKLTLTVLGVPTEGTYSIDGGTISIQLDEDAEDDEESATATLDGGTLVLGANGGGEITFEKE